MTETPPLPDGPLVAWYGDDFTGSAAVMEVLTFSGYPSVLFFDIPTQEQLTRFMGCRGIGVAGISRSKSPDWMDKHLPPVFRFLDSVGAPIRHYKTCSTLDSSPMTGSIGKAIDLAVAPDQWVPVVIAAPAIGRYQAFGNLFAQAGDEVYRLDRHPTMSVHPVTPMSEADVGLHLEKQTERTAGLVDLVSMQQGRTAEQLTKQIKDGRLLITFDVTDPATLSAVGSEIWRRGKDGLFVVGSQGIEYALIDAWRDHGDDLAETGVETAQAMEQIAVVSGSCSPVTEEQITRAEQAGFAVVSVNPVMAVDDHGWGKECAKAVDTALNYLANNISPLVCTARGPGDPAIPAVEEASARFGVSRDALNERIGVGLGRILRQIVKRTGLRRIGIAGGDTSGHGALQLELFAVTAKVPIAPGASLLTGHSNDPAMDGLEIALKGGQMGTPDYFLNLRNGCA